MAKARFEPGAEIETLTPQELAGGLDKFVRDWYQEQARGVGTWRDSRTATIAATNLTLPGTQQAAAPFGPQRGYAVGVRELRVSGLATNDVVSVYRNSVQPANLLRTITAATPFATFAKGACTLRNGDTLIVTGTGLAATGDVTVNGEGQEVPDIDAYKLL